LDTEGGANLIIAVIFILMIGAVLLGMTLAYFENKSACKEENISWWRFVTLRWNKR